MRTKFQEDLANDILVQLEHSPATIAELSTKTNRNYYSVRLVVQTLLDEGRIIRADNRFRNGKLKLVGADTPTAVIPTVELNGQYFKLTEILNMRFNEHPDAARAITRLPMHVTRLLTSALRESNGESQDRTLKLISSEMTRDLRLLESAVAVYKQILDNPINWNPNSLARFTTDPALDRRELSDAYSHYFDNPKEN